MAELEPSTSQAGESDAEAAPAELSAEDALRLAWLWWVVLLLAPFVVFLGLVVMLLYSETPARPTVANVFFIIALLWLGVTVPLAFALRSYCFRGFWEGRPVEPRRYLRGMVTVWLAMEIGGLLSMVGCWASHSLMPCLLPAALAFMLFTPFWPSGNAMEETTGQEDDEQLFHYPR